jgi:hypothetical protein
MGDSMGASVIRKKLVSDINQKFGSKSIKKTAKDLHSLVQAGGDVFDMVHKYAFLDGDMKHHGMRGDITRYKEVQSMPHLHKVLMTHAFRHALTHKPNPLPVQFDVVPGKEEGIEVRTSGRAVKVKLTRVDPPSRR